MPQICRYYVFGNVKRRKNTTWRRAASGRGKARRPRAGTGLSANSGKINYFSLINLFIYLTRFTEKPINNVSAALRSGERLPLMRLFTVRRPEQRRSPGDAAITALLSAMSAYLSAGANPHFVRSTNKCRSSVHDCPTLDESFN